MHSGPQTAVRGFSVCTRPSTPYPPPPHTLHGKRSRTTVPSRPRGKIPQNTPSDGSRAPPITVQRTCDTRQDVQTDTKAYEIPVLTPPSPWHSDRPCIGSGGGGGVTFFLANLLRRPDIELLLCVCWLDTLVLWVHCCVLHIFFLALHCTLYHAKHFSFSQFQPWVLIILTCTQLVLLSGSRLPRPHTHPLG